jgi:hypothetical protein
MRGDLRLVRSVAHTPHRTDTARFFLIDALRDTAPELSRYFLVSSR